MFEWLRFDPRSDTVPEISSGFGRLGHLCLRLFAGLFLTFLLAPAWAGQTQLPFNVNVQNNPSAQTAGTQGSAGLGGTTLQLRSTWYLLQLLRYQHQYTHQHYAERTRPWPMLASLRPVRIASTNNAGDDSDILGSEFNKLSTFTNVSYRFGSHGRTATNPGYDFNTVLFTAGLNYRFRPNLDIGVIAGYLHRHNNLNPAGARLGLNTYSLGLLSNWYVTSSWYIDGITRLGLDAYNAKRLGYKGNSLRATPNGNDISLDVGSGYELHYKGISLVPRGRLIYKHLNIDGYKEHGGPGALRYNGRGINSLRTNLGAMANYAVNTSFGVVIPQLDLEWIHEFEDNAQNLGGYTSTGPAFAMPSADPDRDFFRLGAGAIIILPHGINAFIRYEPELGNANTRRTTVAAGARLEF